MKGNSSKTPPLVEMINNQKYRVCWNVQPINRAARLGMPAIQGFEYDYNSNYYPTEISKKEIMLAIIRERYDANDELSIALRRIGDEAKLQAHEDYIQFARTTADAITMER